jgi:hypothetical protein
LKNFSSLSEIQASLSEGSVSCKSLVSYYLDRIENHKDLNIYLEVFSEEAQKVMQSTKIDTADISVILRNADVNFSKSNPRLKPCAEYFITGKESFSKVSLLVSRCDSTATIQKIIIE